MANTMSHASPRSTHAPALHPPQAPLRRSLNLKPLLTSTKRDRGWSFVRRVPRVRATTAVAPSPERAISAAYTRCNRISTTAFRLGYIRLRGGGCDKFRPLSFPEGEGPCMLLRTNPPNSPSHFSGSDYVICRDEADGCWKVCHARGIDPAFALFALQQSAVANCVKRR